MSLLLGSNLAYGGEILSVDLGGSPASTKNTFTFTQNGFILTATAIDEISSPAQVYQDLNGLGVLANSNQNDDIDGAIPGIDHDYHGPFEKLKLSTNKEVKLIEATFSNADNNDEYRLFIDGVEIQQGDIGDNGITKVVSFESLEDDLRIGTEFAFSSTDDGDFYKILSITFESLNDDQIIGGEILPIETTSLILASTQSISWLIPVIVSITGFGLVLIRRQN